MQSMRVRLCVKFALSIVSALLLGITLRWPQWIEMMFDVDPDGGDGSSEWGLTLTFAAVTILAFASTARDFRNYKKFGSASFREPPR